MLVAIVDLGPWFWLILGGVLGVLEALIPGIFLAWFGAAAFMTGLVAFFVDMSLAQEALVFAGASALSVFAARFFTSDDVSASDGPALNQRDRQMIGRVFRLDEDMVDGRAKVRVGDSLWQVEGPHSAAGSSVRVTGLRGNTLLVEPVASGSAA